MLCNQQQGFICFALALEISNFPSVEKLVEQQTQRVRNGI